jgi:hypothetical protein
LKPYQREPWRNHCCTGCRTKLSLEPVSEAARFQQLFCLLLECRSPETGELCVLAYALAGVGLVVVCWSLGFGCLGCLWKRDALPLETSRSARPAQTSFVGAAAIKYGSLLTPIAAGASPVLAVALVAGPPLAYGAMLLRRGSA